MAISVSSSGALRAISSSTRAWDRSSELDRRDSVTLVLVITMPSMSGSCSRFTAVTEMTSHWPSAWRSRSSAVFCWPGWIATSSSSARKRSTSSGWHTSKTFRSFPNETEWPSTGSVWPLVNRMRPSASTMLTVSEMFWTSARKRCSLATSSAWVDFRSEMSVNAESTPAGAPEGPCSSAVRRPRSRVRPWRSATVMSRNGNGRSADGMRSAVHDGSVDANGAGRPRTSLERPPEHQLRLRVPELDEAFEVGDADGERGVGDDGVELGVGGPQRVLDRAGDGVIVHGDEPVPGGAGGVPDHDEVGHEVGAGAVGPGVPGLAPHRAGRAVGEEGIGPAGPAGQVDRRHEVGDRAAEQLAGLAAGQALERFVRPLHPALEVEHGDAGREQLEGADGHGRVEVPGRASQAGGRSWAFRHRLPRRSVPAVVPRAPVLEP